MTQQFKKTCFTCHAEIYMSKPGPDLPWVKTNLDGSAHIDPERPRSVGQTTVYQQTSKPATTATYQQQTEERQTAISKAHEENMEAGERLRQSIIALTDRLTEMEKTFAIIANSIQAYLDVKS